MWDPNKIVETIVRQSTLRSRLSSSLWVVWTRDVIQKGVCDRGQSHTTSCLCQHCPNLFVTTIIELVQYSTINLILETLFTTQVHEKLSRISLTIGINKIESTVTEDIFHRATSVFLLKWTYPLTHYSVSTKSLLGFGKIGLYLLK